MNQIKQVKEKIAGGGFDGAFGYLYGEGNVAAQRTRYIEAIDEFVKLYGEREITLVSTPGRTEVGGNHTDHQRGRVLAAGVNLDVIAVVSKTDDGVAGVQSKGFKKDEVDLSLLTPQEAEVNHAASLIRGIAARFQALGYKIGGFVAYTTSDVPPGSGLSSSAAFEGLIGGIFSVLYNGGAVEPIELAKIGQYAENEFFKKPCGLMDQTACAVGGFVTIDFKEKNEPVVEKVSFNFKDSGYALCIVDTKGKHADLTDDYAAMPKDMKSVAGVFGKEVLREVPYEEFLERLGELHGNVSDRAIVRAFHFYADNDRVPKEVTALKSGDFNRFLELIIESGRSSGIYLQNLYSVKSFDEQGLTVALALSEELLKGKGAWRVHGGGVAGTIQAFVPENFVNTYKEAIDRVFGEGSCHILSIRPVGICEVTENLL